MKKQLLIFLLLFLGINAFAQVPNYVPTNGLVGYWPFNGNANDESGNGNNGTVNGATLTTDRFGVANKAYDFNAFDWGWGSGGDYVYIPYNPTFNSPEITISVWFKQSSIYISNQVYPTIIKRYEGGYTNPNGQTWGIYSNTNGNMLNSSILPPNTTNNYSVYLTQSGPSISSNIWHNSILSFDGVSMKTYYDGQLVSTVPSNGMVMNANGNSGISVGMSIQANGNWDPFHGQIDDIGIWNRAITSCEIQGLYNAQLNSLAVSGGSDTTICVGEALTLNGSGAANYAWSNGISDGVPHVFTSIDLGNNELILTGTDANGCMGTDTVNVFVNNISSSTLTETALDSYTLNGQTYTQSGIYTQVIPNEAGCDSTITLNLTLNFTGLNELQSSITVAPNPTMDFLTITSTDALYEEYVLFDPQGRTVLSGTLTGTSTQLDLSKLARGNYMLQIGEKLTPIKLIKE